MHRTEDLPPIDERLVAPGTRYEIIDGVVTHVPPADPPHAIRHSKVSALVEAHAHADFEVASDLLTRTSRIDDIAPDVSVYPRAPDPSTGGRSLEQLVFQVVSMESISHARTKAEKLAERGVRRIFAIDLVRDRALEWSRELGTWRVLDTYGSIDDPALAVPLSIDALLHTANTDDAVGRALLAKRTPVIEAARAVDRAQGIASGHAEGIADGRAEALITILVARGLAPTVSEREKILAVRDPARLQTWLVRAVSCGSLADLFAET